MSSTTRAPQGEGMPMNALAPPGEGAPLAQATPELARPVAYSALAGLAGQLDVTMAAIEQTRATVATWTNDFWEVSGYKKSDVMPILNQLGGLRNAYTGQHKDRAAVLREQAAAEQTP
jgi:hypothetical protein